MAPNPTTSRVGVRHTAAEVTNWSYFLIDMDPIEKNPRPDLALEQALLWLGEWMGLDFGKRRPIIIDSGRGMQAWIRLEDVILDDVTPGDTIHSVANDDNRKAVSRRTARKVNGYWLKKLDERLGLIHGCKIDTSVSDLPRVMRCPGTINIKTRRETRLVEPSLIIFRGLATRLVVGTPSQLLSEPDPTPVRVGMKWNRSLPYLTKMAQDYLLNGREEPGRHKVMWHTAKKMQEVGVSRDEVRRALRRANSLRGPDMELSQEEVEHALRTAFGA